MGKAKRVIGIDYGNWNAFVACVENMDPQTRMGGTVRDLIPDRYREMGETGIPNEAYWGIKKAQQGNSYDEIQSYGFEAIRESNYPPENHLRLLKRNIKNSVTLNATRGTEKISRTFQYKDLIVKTFEYIVSLANEALREAYGEEGTTNLISLTYPAVLSDPSSLRYFVDLAEKADSGARDEKGNMLKIKVVGTVCEPAAAGLDRLSEQKDGMLKETVTYGVCDFGGGTYDLSIVSLYPKGRKYDNGEMYYFDIVGSAEGLNIGGNDLTRILEDLFNSKLKEQIGKDPSTMNKRTTRRNVERCKFELSSDVKDVSISYEVDDDIIDIYVSRTEFERAISPKIKEVADHTQDFFNRHKNHLPDAIIMTGGTSHIPYVREQLENVLPEFKGRIYLHRPSKGAAYGAARFYNGFDNKKSALRKKVDFDIGTDIFSGVTQQMVTLIPAGTEIPCSSEEIGFETSTYGQASTGYDIYEAKSKDPNKANVKGDYRLIHNAVLRHGSLPNQKVASRCVLSIDALGTIRLRAWKEDDNSVVPIDHTFALNGN